MIEPARTHHSFGELASGLQERNVVHQVKRLQWSVGAHLVHRTDLTIRKIEVDH